MPNGPRLLLGFLFVPREGGLLPVGLRFLPDGLRFLTGGLVKGSMFRCVVSSLSCRFSSPTGRRALSTIPAGFLVVPRSPCLRPVGEVPRDWGRGGASLKNRCCCCAKRCPSVPGAVIFLFAAAFAISLMSSFGLPFFLRNNVGSPIPNLLFLSISLRKSFCDNGFIVPGLATFTGASPSRCNLAASRCKSFVGNC